MGSRRSIDPQTGDVIASGGAPTIGTSWDREHHALRVWPGPAAGVGRRRRDRSRDRGGRRASRSATTSRSSPRPASTPIASPGSAGSRGRIRSAARRSRSSSSGRRSACSIARVSTTRPSWWARRDVGRVGRPLGRRSAPDGFEAIDGDRRGRRAGRSDPRGTRVLPDVPARVRLRGAVRRRVRDLPHVHHRGDAGRGSLSRCCALGASRRQVFGSVLLESIVTGSTRVGPRVGAGRAGGRVKSLLAGMARSCPRPA